jgi:hypothetical protein
LSRPTNKQDLLSQSQRSFDDLMGVVASIPPLDLGLPGVNGKWAVKDVLAHLSAWHALMEGWYTEGMRGRKPEIPAPGFTWKTTPQLNDRIFQDHKGDAPQRAIRNLHGSHARMHQLIAKHSQSELFTKKKYPWTGTTSLGAYFVSSTSSHYEWAIDMIRRWLKSRRK